MELRAELEVEYTCGISVMGSYGCGISLLREGNANDKTGNREKNKDFLSSNGDQ